MQNSAHSIEEVRHYFPPFAESYFKLSLRFLHSHLVEFATGAAAVSGIQGSQITDSSRTAFLKSPLSFRYCCPGLCMLAMRRWLFQELFHMVISTYFF